MTKLGVAVIGFGTWGRNLARNFGAATGCDLRWICDVDGSRLSRARAAHTVGVTQRLEEVLGDPRVDAVAVATPPQSHFELAARCLEAGRHVLVEKPMACSVPDGEQLITTAAQHGVVLMCDHTYCYSPNALRLRDLVQHGDLGGVQHIESARLSSGKVQSEVDVFWDLAAHDLSLLDYILPSDCRVDQIAAHGSDPIGAGQTCSGELDAQLSDGSHAHVHVSWLSETKVRRLTVTGTRRVAVWDDLQPAGRLTIHDTDEFLDRPNGDTTTRVPVRRRETHGRGRRVRPDEEPLRGVVRELIASIAEGRDPQTDGLSALRVLHGLTAVSRSLALDGAAASVWAHETERSAST
jgi:predicted dehydrogenase